MYNDAVFDTKFDIKLKVYAEHLLISIMGSKATEERSKYYETAFSYSFLKSINKRFHAFPSISDIYKQVNYLIKEKKYKTYQLSNSVCLVLQLFDKEIPLEIESIPAIKVVKAFNNKKLNFYSILKDLHGPSARVTWRNRREGEGEIIDDRDGAEDEIIYENFYPEDDEIMEDREDLMIYDRDVEMRRNRLYDRFQRRLAWERNVYNRGHFIHSSGLSYLIAVLKDGRLAACSKNYNIKVFSSDFKLDYVIKTDFFYINSLEVLENNHLVVVSREWNSIRILELGSDNCQCVLELKDTRKVIGLQYNKICSFSGNQLNIWEYKNGKYNLIKSSKEGLNIQRVEKVGDDNIVSFSSDYTLTFWDEELKKIKVNHTDLQACIGLLTLRNRKYFFFFGTYSFIIFDGRTFEFKRKIDKRINSAKEIPNGKILVAQANNLCVQIMNADTFQIETNLIIDLKSPIVPMSNFVFFEDEMLLAFGTKWLVGIDLKTFKLISKKPTESLVNTISTCRNKVYLFHDAELRGHLSVLDMSPIELEKIRNLDFFEHPPN